MLTRIITAVVGLPILIFIIYIGGLPLKLAVAAVSLVGMYEFYRAMSKKIKPIHVMGFLMELILLLIIYTNIPKVMTYSICLMALVLVLLFIVIGHKDYNVYDVLITVFGFLYVGAMLASISVIRDYPRGMFFVWLVFIFSFASDTGAYFVGTCFGRHKLTPELSPKKSVEGAVGGLFSSAVLSALYTYICLRSAGMTALMFILGLIGSFFAQSGDLAASSIKRYVGIKDYGRIFPGHGGVLDRFDSVLFTAPFVLFCQVIVKGIHLF